MPHRAREHTDEFDRPGGWSRSRPSRGLRLTPWLLAIGVVAVLAIGLHALYY
jgi:hypothetical protein